MNICVDGDQVAAVAVGLMIIMVSVKIIGGCFGEFTEKAVDFETMQQITNIINSDSQVKQWHNLRTRTVGREIFLDLHSANQFNVRDGSPIKAPVTN